MLSSASGRRNAIEFAIQDIRAMGESPAKEPMPVARYSPGREGLFHWPRRRPASAWAVAAVLLIGLGVVYWNGPHVQQDTVAKTEVEQSQSTDATSSVAENSTAVASLSYVSPEVRWKENSSVASGSDVPQGKLFAIEEGEIELTYASGTRLMLIGPADYLVKNTGGELRRGGLIASVTEDGHGFTIQTPNGSVVDLGTEFGLVVDDFGVSEVSVFQGKVEAHPVGRKSDGKKVELTKGHGLQWSENDLISLDADLRRFAGSLLHGQPVTVDSKSHTLLLDGFNQVELDENNWKSLGDVRVSSEGIQLAGSDTGQRPYLITTKQYDPSQGTIIVSCDIRFAQSDLRENAPAFSILTRSADQRGKAPAPWNDLLASCVRCSFGADEHAGGGLLQAGVKLEGDRELTETSWSSFLRPKPGDVYRLVMRDNGINVSFTVSLRDDPTTAKTVSCRSLFRGLANFIALESPAHTMTTIERVEIHQDRSVMKLSDYASFSTLVQERGKQNESERHLLSSLVPEGATLLLQDDFNSKDLDQVKWKWLGDVLATGGAVQLGLPNPESHIDSWKPRPYLLTRVPVDLRKGEISIVGKITFSDNFLAGYGASFAAMTRANDQCGQGPGWENSVLQKGVRLNFWPASWDTDHSLEVHEKATSNSLSLLATQGLEVDPRVRTYLFRVIDNGEEVELSIVDPLRPSKINSITTRTYSDLRKGFIGFESCWGSPVILDDVAIYQSTHK